MEVKEQARIVAFARLLGATGTDKEIFDKYCEYYQNAVRTLTTQTIEQTHTELNLANSD